MAEPSANSEMGRTEPLSLLGLQPMAEPSANSEMGRTEPLTSEVISDSCSSRTKKISKELTSDIHCSCEVRVESVIARGAMN